MDLVLRVYSGLLVAFILTSCSGVTPRVEVSGCNNVVTINQEREGGGTVDVKPDVSWGNLVQ